MVIFCESVRRPPKLLFRRFHKLLSKLWVSLPPTRTSIRRDIDAVASIFYRQPLFDKKNKPIGDFLIIFRWSAHTFILPPPVKNSFCLKNYPSKWRQAKIVNQFRNPTLTAKPAKLQPRLRKKISSFAPCKTEYKNYTLPSSPLLVQHIGKVGSVVAFVLGADNRPCMGSICYSLRISFGALEIT